MVFLLSSLALWESTLGSWKRRWMSLFLGKEILKAGNGEKGSERDIYTNHVFWIQIHSLITMIELTVPLLHNKRVGWDC